MTFFRRHPRHTAAAAAVAAALAATLGPAQASAQNLPPLSENAYINERLIAARAADRIRRTCPTISARLVYAYSQAYALKRYARNLGYTEAQIEAFLDSKTEKRRIYAAAETYLKANGATEGNVQGFCKLGRDEIARKSIIGSLLSAT